MARVLVLGAGALGGLLGALLREANHDVMLVARPAQVDAIVREGLLFTGGAYGPPRRVPVKAAPRAARGAPPDLVILAVKTQDAESALREHAEGLGASPVVALQNGLAQDAIVTRAVGPARAVAAVVSLDAEHVEPGHVDCARRGTLTIGAAHPEGEAAAEHAARILAQAVRVRRSRNVAGARWMKLLVNLGNVVPALTGLSFQACAAHPRLSLAHVALLREGLAVADAEGARLARIPWTSPALVRTLASLPDPLARRAYAMRVRMVLGSPPAFGSTWQSLQRGASVETPWLNGEIVRRGAARKVPTPANAASVDLIDSGKRLAPDEVARALLG